MKFYTYLIVLVLLSTTFCYQLRHTSGHHKKQDNIDWTKQVVGPHSPQVGVLNIGEGDLTTNWNEMVNNPSKKVLSLGIPAEVDMNQHIAVGNQYEDVVYVKTDKTQTVPEVHEQVLQPVTSYTGKFTAPYQNARLAKKTETQSKTEAKTESNSEVKTDSNTKVQTQSKNQNKDLYETVTPEEHALEDLVAVEFDRDVPTAFEAFNNLVRHQDQILAFLSSIEQVEYLSEHQQTVVSQLVKYIKLVTGAHEDLKQQETEDDAAFIQEIGSRIRLYTFGVDSQHYKKTKAESQQNWLTPQHQKAHKRLVRQLKFTEEHLHVFLNKGAPFIPEMLRQAEKLEAQAQKAFKVMQTHWVIDQIRKDNVLKHGQEQKDLATNFKQYIRSESETLNNWQNNLERFDQEITDNQEPDAAQFEKWANNDSYYVNDKTRQNLLLAKHSMEIEDLETATKTLDLVKEHLRSKINEISQNLLVVQRHFQMCMTLEDQVNANDMAGVEDNLEALADDCFDNQTLVVSNAEIDKAAKQLKKAINEEQFNFAETLTKTLMSIAYSTEYAKPSFGSLDFIDQSTVGLNDKLHGYNVVGLQYLLDETLQDLQSENYQGADNRIERLADRAQQVTKINKVQAVLRNVNNEAEFASGIEELKKMQTQETANLQNDRKELGEALDRLGALPDSIFTEPFEQSSRKIASIIDNENINSDLKWALMYAKKYVDQNDPTIAQHHLAHALTWLNTDILNLDTSLESIHRQNDLLDKALHLANQQDVHVTSAYLDQVVDEINYNQSICEIDEAIENNCQDAKQAMEEGENEKATKFLYEVVKGLNDPVGKGRRDREDFPRILKQTEERGSYVDGHQGEDIRDVNLSVDQIAHGHELEQVQNLVDDVIKNLEEMDVNVQDHAWLTQPHKLEAERKLEQLYTLSQRFYKLIDVRTTLAKVSNAVEAQSGVAALEDAITDLEQSNDEEKERLDKMTSDLKNLQDALNHALEKINDEQVSNVEATTTIRELLSDEYANVVVQESIQEVVQYLDANKVPSAHEKVVFALQHLDQQLYGVTQSLLSLKQQNEALEDAMKFAKAEDAVKLRETLSALEHRVEESQPVVLTDTDCTELYNKIRESIHEGKPGQAAQAVEELGAAVATELKAQKDFQHRAPEDSASPELQQQHAMQLEHDVINAENAVNEGNKADAADAVETVHETVQADAKVKLVEVTKSHVEEALQNGDHAAAGQAIEDLKENLEEEKELLEEEKEKLEEAKEEVEKASENDENSEESEETADELEEEIKENDAVPSEVQEQLEAAHDAAQEGDAKDYEDALEEAVETLEDEEDKLDQSVQAVESQVETLETAAEASQSGDEQNTLKALADVVESVRDNQPNVRTSEPAKESADQAKQAIENGDQVEAVQHVEDIVTSADSTVNKEVGLEEGQATEFEEANPLVSALEALADALQPEDVSTLDQNELHSLLNDVKNVPEAADYLNQLEAVGVSIESNDFETAVAQVEALLEQLLGESGEENPEEADVKKSQKATKKANKKVNKKAAQAAKAVRAAKRAEKYAKKHEEKQEDTKSKKSDRDDKKLMIRKSNLRK